MNLRRVAAIAALILPSALLLAPIVHAQAPRDRRFRDEHNEDLTLAVGETKTISAQDVKNYNDSGQGVIDIRLTPDGAQFVIVGKKAGTTTLLLIKHDGTQITYEITVTTAPDPGRRDASFSSSSKARSASVFVRSAPASSSKGA